MSSSYHSFSLMKKLQKDQDRTNGQHTRQVALRVRSSLHAAARNFCFVQADKEEVINGGFYSLNHQFSKA
jgi:hypothetical protein